MAALEREEGIAMLAANFGASSLISSRPPFWTVQSSNDKEFFGFRAINGFFRCAIERLSFYVKR